MSTTGTVTHFGSIVDRDLFRPLTDAAEIIRAARRSAAAVEASAQQAAQAARDTGYAEGFEAGRREAVVSVLGTLLVERRLRDVLANRLVQLVEAAVRVLLGDVADEDLARHRIRALVTSPTAQAPGARLHVPPQHVQAATRTVAQTGEAMETDPHWLTVIADDSLQAHDAVLESDAGFIEARLELQLEDLRDLLGDALARALQSTQSTAS